MTHQPVNTAHEPSKISPELMAELQDRAERAASGVIDPEARRLARERMDRMRDLFRQTNGEVNLAVELIRDARERT